MNLKSTNKVEENKVELEIEVNAEDFEAAVEKAYQKAKKKITVPGFRPGKATRKMIEKTYGESAFYEDAVNSIYPAAVTEAIDEAKLTLVDRPEVEVTAVSKEEGVKIKATCITKPEIQVEGYKGIEVEKVVNDVTDEEVDAEVNKLREQGARIISVDDRAAKMEDEVVIDFEGFLDNVAFEGGKGENFTLGLGSGQFIPGFEEQIVDHNIGDEFDVNVTFPEDYQASDLAGKAVVFKVKLHEIKVKELPEVDEEFVKDTTEFDTVDELKADLRKKLEEAAEKKAEADVENKLVDTVIEKMTGEIPEVMFTKRVDDMVADFKNRLGSQGMDIDVYLQYTGMDMDAFRKTFEEQATKQVKLRLALEKITDLENIEVSDEEVEAEFAKLAETYKMEVEQVKMYVPAVELKKDLSVSKAVEFIKSEAVIK